MAKADVLFLNEGSLVRRHIRSHSKSHQKIGACKVFNVLSLVKGVAAFIWMCAHLVATLGAIGILWGAFLEAEGLVYLVFLLQIATLIVGFFAIQSFTLFSKENRPFIWKE